MCLNSQPPCASIALRNTSSDGVCAAFASPRSAVDAAVAAQQKLELPVCMGIATGEAELRGSDYFGAVLNRATRRNQADGVMDKSKVALAQADARKR